MFSCFPNLFSSSVAPSAFILVRTLDEDTDAMLHVVSEDGTIETCSSSTRPGSATVITVRQSNGERKPAPSCYDRFPMNGIWAEKGQADSVEVSQLVEEALNRRHSIPSMPCILLPVEGIETYYVYIVYVNRPKPGCITGEP
ncbi:hypothetical protein BC628DRAFT_1419956 [Trametes gibbosa]|nr:hypothetical protein BC628DRAFT_1419956 [Trametes gibbosa]